MKLILAILLAGTVSVSAQSGADSLQVALQLGNVLASEDHCGLSYDESAIEAYIVKNVAADDMAFVSNLDMLTGGAEQQIKDQSPSAKAAHCSQVRRVAKANGFID